MKNVFYHIVFLGIVSTFSTYAQLDSIQQLDEVILSDVKLHTFSKGYKRTRLSDSILQIHTHSLTDVLRFNSTLYLKEHGYGMTSSVAFRGTNAAQTAVIWNGIAVNSVLNGQTDFNTILPQSFDNVIIRSGGGSVQYGSGAVGGSIHLNNDIQFKTINNKYLQIGYGSYNTLSGTVKTQQAGDKTYLDAGVIFVASDNDYTVLKTEGKNENGALSRFTGFLNTGFKFGNQVLTFQSNYYYGNRNFSSTLTTINKDNYKDVNTRNLLQWKIISQKWEGIAKVAHLFERYRYYPDKEQSLYFEGAANTFLGEYSFTYFVSKEIEVHALTNFTYIKATGSNIGGNNRRTLSPVVLWSHRVSNKFRYGFQLRKEFLNDFDNPLLLAIEGNYQISKRFSVLFNASKNYRVPTFNDLFWQGGGNPNLQPETSLQGEIGGEFTFKNGRISTQLYLINSKDLIKWIPQNSGIWEPVNIAEVQNYGTEVTVNYQVKKGNHHVDFLSGYGFTKAIDQQSNKQLIYVPYHKLTAGIDYQYKKMNTYIQLLHNAKVFTTTDNKEELPGYQVVNAGLSYVFNTVKTLGVRINNVFNTYYENVAYRPMPNRNIQVYLNLKF